MSERSAREIENDLVYELPHFPCLCIDGSQPQPGKPAIDSFIDILGEYHIYVSWEMARTHGLKLGMVEREEAESLKALAEQYAARVAELETELAEARPALDAMARAAQRWGDTEAADEPVRRTGRRAA